MCRMLFLKGRSHKIIRCSSEPFESVCRAVFAKRFNWLCGVSSEPVGMNGVRVQHDTMGTASRFWMLMALEKMRKRRMCDALLCHLPRADWRVARASTSPQLVPVLFMPAPDIADKCPLPVGRRTGGIRVHPGFELRMQVIEVPSWAF